jgi:hypothetical protein
VNEKIAREIDKIASVRLTRESTGDGKKAKIAVKIRIKIPPAPTYPSRLR